MNAIDEWYEQEVRSLDESFLESGEDTPKKSMDDYISSLKQLRAEYVRRYTKELSKKPATNTKARMKKYFDREQNPSLHVDHFDFRRSSLDRLKLRSDMAKFYLTRRKNHFLLRHLPDSWVHSYYRMLLLLGRGKQHVQNFFRATIANIIELFASLYEKCKALYGKIVSTASQFFSRFSRKKEKGGKELPAPKQGNSAQKNTDDGSQTKQSEP